MSGRNQRGARGYVLIEALVGGAVLMLALGGVMAGLAEANGHVARAVADQNRTQLLVEQAERLRALPLSNAQWTPGTHKPCISAELPGTWTCQLDVVTVTDNDIGGAAGPLTYRRAVVTITTGSNTSRSMAVLKW
jgi:Tfp pilus assembly protein PilV